MKKVFYDYIDKRIKKLALSEADVRVLASFPPEADPPWAEAISFIRIRTCERTTTSCFFPNKLKAISYQLTLVQPHSGPPVSFSLWTRSGTGFLLHYFILFRAVKQGSVEKLLFICVFHYI
ncbi:hypothetical protein CL629_04275 [bacterium]|nr:hypothetical protein [bacterium]